VDKIENFQDERARRETTENAIKKSTDVSFRSDPVGLEVRNLESKTSTQAPTPTVPIPRRSGNAFGEVLSVFWVKPREIGRQNRRGVPKSKSAN
jgi:hypothetical protein